MDEKSGGRKRPRITRRAFVGAMGAAATATVLQRDRMRAAASEAYYFQDSFGNISQVDQSLIDLGIYPPPPSRIP